MLLLQGQDPNWQPIVDRLLLEAEPTNRHHEYSTLKTFYIPQLLDGTNAAMRMCHPAHGPDPDNDPIVMPTTAVHALLHMYHDQNGHYPGINKTMQTIRLKYWWPTYRTDITTYINSCQFCQWKNSSRRNTNPPIQAYTLPAQPFSTAQIDLTKCARTTTGFLYIMVVKCPLTKYVELIPLIDKSPLEIAIALIHRIYYRYGSPDILISDNGTEFVNKILAHISAIYQVKHVTTTGYHPQANGLVEQHNQTLKNQLKAFTNAQQSDWDVHLDIVQFAYNTTVHNVTGFSPHFMVYGREAKQPHESWIGKFTKVTSLPQYVNALVKTLQTVWQATAEHKTAEVAQMNKATAKKHTFVEYQVGDRFYLAQEPDRTFTDYNDPKRIQYSLSPKLQVKYYGPYVITKKYSPVLYESKLNDIVRTVHAIHMKPDANKKYPTPIRIRPHRAQEDTNVYTVSGQQRQAHHSLSRDQETQSFSPTRFTTCPTKST
jgi:hypothetical protein